VKVNEFLVLKKLVDGPTHRVANTGHRPEGVGPRSQMGNGPQKLVRVPFLLKRILFRIGPTQHGDFFGPKFDPLPFPRGALQHTYHCDGAPRL
jgi:hypothetical protein